MDPLAPRCPHCEALNPDSKLAGKFAHQIITPFWKQLVFFLVGLGGLEIFGLLLSVIVQGVVIANHPGASTEELTKLLSEPSTLFVVNAGVYIVLAVVLSLIMWRHWPKLFQNMKGWVPYVAGLVGLVVILGTEMLYNVGASAILQSLGIKPSGNANQSSIEIMSLAIPAGSIFVFGILGPFVEEVTYRVGLFGFLCRVNKAFGYIVGMLIFAFIHFNWQAIWSPAYDGALIVELVNLPPYLFAGAVFCFLYDRFGFGASFSAHALNNLISITLILVAPNA